MWKHGSIVSRPNAVSSSTFISVLTPSASMLSSNGLLDRFAWFLHAIWTAENHVQWKKTRKPFGGSIQLSPSNNKALAARAAPLSLDKGWKEKKGKKRNGKVINRTSSISPLKPTSRVRQQPVSRKRLTLGHGHLVLKYK